ncbi:MAG: hypothetical protein CH104c_0471 [Candidatus Woesebacteria bacterium]|nr:MAG: hypothetical protein CH104c_0471 [Candidatus Woesebacteria bacterium]
MSTENVKILTFQDLERIKNWGERTFAEACLGKPHIKLEYQVPINGHNHQNGNGGSSLIDFRVTNLKAGKSKLVEVTETPKKHLFRSSCKVRQIGNLKSNGESFVVLTGENLVSINRYLKKEDDV